MLKETINEKYKEAMLNKDDDRKRVINSLKAEMKNKEIELRTSGKDLVDADILSLIQKIIKQTKDAVKMFEDGGRQDLVEKNQKEISILEEFLPKQMTNDEVDKIIIDQINGNGYSSVKDMGKIMAYFKSNYSGQCDMSYVSNRIKDILQGYSERIIKIPLDNNK